MDIGIVFIAILVIVGFVALYLLISQREGKGSGQAELVATLQRQLQEVEARQAPLNTQIGALNKRLGEAEGAYATLREAHDVLTEQYREAVRATSEATEREAQQREAAGRARDALGRAGSDLGAQSQQLEDALRELRQARGDIEKLRIDEGAAQREVKTLIEERNVLRDERTKALADRDIAQNDAAKAVAAKSEADANAKHLAESNTQMRTFLDEAQSKLSAAFSEMAGKVLGERTAQLEQNLQNTTLQSKTDLQEILKPFAERLSDFRQRVDQVYVDEAKERAGLVTQITDLKGLNQHIADTAQALTKALKSSAKVRGDWGEMALDSVLSASGLIEGQHYEKQYAVRTEEGGSRRPDVIVKLPGDRRIVVDAKALLNNYQAAMNTDDEPEQQKLLRVHASSLRLHVNDLAKKNYPKLIDGDALEFTIAFVPVEGALSAAIAVDPQLQIDAFEQRVALATPNTIIALLSLCNRIWQREKVQREAEEIGKLGGMLLTSVQNFMATFDKLGEQIDSAGRAHREARGQLHDSTQSVAARSRRLEELGIRAFKATRAPRQRRAELGGESDIPAGEHPQLGTDATSTANADSTTDNSIPDEDAPAIASTG